MSAKNNISKDPYMLKAEWLIKATEAEILTFFRNRIVYSKYMGLPVDEARGENPEDFLIWVYQREDESFKKKFASALGELMSELFEQIRQGHKDRTVALSGVLHIASKNRIVSVVKVLQEKLITSNHLGELAHGLYKMEGRYTFCILHQALLTLTVLEAAIGKPSERVLSQPFWETILDNNDLPDFRGLAIRGLGYIDWRLAFERLPLFIDELLEKSDQEHPDDIMFSFAAALKFLFERLIIENKSSPDYLESWTVEYFIETVTGRLCVYRYKPQLKEALDLTERTLRYLNERHEFTGNKELINRAADLIDSLPDAVIAGTTASLEALGNKQEPDTRDEDSLNLDFWFSGRKEIKQKRYGRMMECAV